MGLNRSLRLRVFQELAFSANIAAVLVIIFLACASTSWATSDKGYSNASDAGYYFLKAAIRLTDFLHLPTVNEVSAEALARNGQTQWFYRGQVILLLVSLATATLLLTPLLRRLVNRISGFAAAAAAALCYYLLLPQRWFYPDDRSVVPIAILLVGVAVFVRKTDPVPAAGWRIPAALLSLALLLLLYSPGVPRAIRVKDINSLTMHFAGGPCRGSCVPYKITIHGNGELEAFRSGDRRRPPLIKKTSISRAQIDSIIAALNRVHYLNLSDRAFTWCFDTRSAGVEVLWDGDAKKVSADISCVGAKGGAQDRFVTAFREIVGGVFPEAEQR
jgi:hypothetical protein